MSAAPQARTRADATRLGLTRFNNGVPCPAGHVAERYTLSSACVVCVRANKEANLLKVKAARLRVQQSSAAASSP